MIVYLNGPYLFTLGWLALAVTAVLLLALAVGGLVADWIFR